jgi:hypothetical protein
MRSKIALITIFSIGIVLSSCIEHEVIPAPTSNVDLNAYVNCFANGTQVELSQNVNGYKGFATKDVYIYAAPVLSKVIYSSIVSSPFAPQALKISMGALDWDASANSDPTLNMFNEYHSSNSQISIPFKDYNTLVNTNSDGIHVEYTDKNGVVWKTKESDPNQSAKLKVIKKASDITGDYFLFECSFSCKVWTYDIQLQKDISITINNLVFRGWFKK